MSSPFSLPSLDRYHLHLPSIHSILYPTFSLFICSPICPSPTHSSIHSSLPSSLPSSPTYLSIYPTHPYAHWSVLISLHLTTQQQPTTNYMLWLWRKASLGYQCLWEVYSQWPTNTGSNTVWGVVVVLVNLGIYYSEDKVLEKLDWGDSENITVPGSPFQFLLLLFSLPANLGVMWHPLEQYKEKLLHSW